ncbi:MAG TPA: hypothetical protein VL595_29275 [Pseudonocardia sp.]|nr:hypothetical protein [Pseudonocardia sp.]
MTDQLPQAGARYLPFSAGTHIRDERAGEVPDDREAQVAAVGQVKARRATMVAARTLWPIAGLAIVVAIFYGEQTSGLATLVAAVTVVACVVGTWLLYRRADQLEQAVRRADEQVGIPIPAHLVAEVSQAGVPVRTLTGWFGEIDPRDPDEVKTLRRARRRALEIDGAWLDELHTVRRCWVEGDRDGWDRAARALEPIARRATELDAELTGRMAGPA